MSDMLQLVVEIGSTHAVILPRKSHIESSNLDDKLKSLLQKSIAAKR